MSYQRMHKVAGILVPLPPRKGPIPSQSVVGRAKPPVAVPVAAPIPQPPAAPQPLAASVPRVSAEQGGEPSPAFLEIVEHIYEYNSHKVTGLVRRLENPVELRRAHDLERAHPGFPPEGRRGVRDAIEERLGELGVTNPNEAGDL